MNAASSPVRVLLIAPPPRITGGQAVQATRLVAALRRDPSLTVDFQPLGPDPPGWLRNAREIKGVRTIAAWLTYVVSLLRRVPRCSVVHVFSAAYTSYMLWTLPALAVAKLFRKPIVLNYRDGRAEGHLRDWRTAVPTIRRMDAVVAPSGFLVEVFARHGVVSESISNIIDPSRFRYRRRRVLRPVFLHNRTLEPLYNVACTLRAFQIIQRQYPDASLTVANDGPLRGELEALARELGLRNTQFVGVVRAEDVPAQYDAADVYLMSPDLDCMPGSLLECFVSGLPVVTTDAGGISYIATHDETALMVPKGDHEAMARAALRLLGDPDLVERVTRNAYESSSRYAEGPVREQWVALYRRLRKSA